MDIIPKTHEIISYLLNHTNLLSEWEQTFVGNLHYWLTVRGKEPDQIQLMLLTVIYNKIKKIN